MSSRHARRKAKDRAALIVGTVAANLSQAKPLGHWAEFNGRASVTPLATKSARFNDPIGAVFKARTVDRPAIGPRTAFFKGHGMREYRLEFYPDKIVRVMLSGDK